MALLLLGACTGGEDAGETAHSAAGAVDPGHPLDRHLEERYTPDLPEILERRYLRVLTTFSRTGFFVHQGRPRGFEHALLRDYARELNAARAGGGPEVVLEFIPVPRDQLLPGLLEGRGDIAAAGITVTPSRERRIDFTTPYLSGIDELVVAHRSVADAISSAEDLSGRRVLVHPASSHRQSLLDLNRRLEAAGLATVTIETAPENLDHEDLLELVNTGAIPLTIADSHVAGLWAQVFPEIRILPSAAVARDREIAWMVREESPALKASLDRFLRTRRQGTLLGNIYFRRYYEDARWIRNPLSASTPRLDRLFRRYGAEYGFDWLLLKALAFQESGLEQGRRSPAGAVGIMQVLPSTAREVGVNGEKIATPAGNIRAGTRYLARLRDEVFAEPDLRERDRVRFALAAYNAGPSKVRRARRLAAEMGLDPDRWFRNVELAMLRIVGTETVRYVSNVNKYYVLYRHSRQEQERRRERLAGLAATPEAPGPASAPAASASPP